MIADEAQVNHALIAYHFGTVGKLMEEVVLRCLEKLQDRILPALNVFEQKLREVDYPELKDTVFTGWHGAFGTFAG